MSEIKENILGNDIVTDVSDVILGAVGDVEPCGPMTVTDGGSVSCTIETPADLTDFSCRDDNELCRTDCLKDEVKKTWFYGYYLILDVKGLVAGFDAYNVNDVLSTYQDDLTNNISVSAVSPTDLVHSLAVNNLIMSANTSLEGDIYYVCKTMIYNNINKPTVAISVPTTITVPGHTQYTGDVLWYCVASSGSVNSVEQIININTLNPSSDEANTIYVAPKTYTLSLLNIGGEDNPQPCIAKYSPFRLTLASEDNNSVSFHCFLKRSGYYSFMIDTIKLQTPYDILTSQIERPGYLFPSKQVDLINTLEYYNLNLLLPSTVISDKKVMTIDGLKQLFPNIDLNKAPFDLFIEDDNEKFILNQNQIIKFKDVAGIRHNANMFSLGIDSAQTRTIILAPGISVSPELSKPEING